MACGKTDNGHGRGENSNDDLHCGHPRAFASENVDERRPQELEVPRYSRKLRYPRYRSFIPMSVKKQTTSCARCQRKAFSEIGGKAPEGRFFKRGVFHVFRNTGHESFMWVAGCCPERNLCKRPGSQIRQIIIKLFQVLIFESSQVIFARVYSASQGPGGQYPGRTHKKLRSTRNKIGSAMADPFKNQS